MALNLVILIGALIVSGLVLTWLIQVVKTTISTAIGVAIVVLVLQLYFGIGPEQLWQQITQLPEFLWQLVTGKR
ncbi:MAG: hypothetical protein VKJ46_08780 [Leptolyngbyaceae bacterium]|nr:hypothetical protein [Leptolyngbyaceae bacterium]